MVCARGGYRSGVHRRFSVFSPPLMQAFTHRKLNRRKHVAASFAGSVLSPGRRTILPP